jgi:Domain of Unknown Function with PDB structure (DUF3857)
MRRPDSRTAAAVIGLAVLLPAIAIAGRWDPIPAGEIAATAPTVEPGADAEALFWEIRAEDEFSGSSVSTAVHQHLRIRVFTERGKEKCSQVDIVQGDDFRVRDIQARTVLPDGRTLEVKSSDIFERTIVRARRGKVKGFSFTFPGVVPGALLEYRWTEMRLEGGMNTVFELQRDIPVRTIVCRLQPILSTAGPGFRYTMHNAAMSRFERDPDGYQTATMTNVPAFREEPMMPPEVELRAWVATYYADDANTDPDQYWNAYGKRLYENDRTRISTAREIRETAHRVVGDASTDDEKLRRLYEYCRRDIRNLSNAHLTDDQWLKVKWPRDARETLERREGSGGTINLLFASLAASLGYDARIARVADREVSYFRRTELITWQLSTSHVVVKVGDAWRSFDPATTALPPGMLRWQEEGQPALVPDARAPAWVNTTSLDGAGTRTSRIGTFMLFDDGTLDGRLKFSYGGHAGIELKERYEELDAAGREEAFRDGVRALMPAAELADIRFTNVDTAELPVVIQCQLRVAGFAQATGRRLFFRPAVFQTGRPALFTDERRTHPIDFRFAWSEYDSVVIHLPDGYALEHPESPGDYEIGDVGRYAVRLGAANDNRILVYRREFAFDHVRFARSQYDALREGFGAVHERDAHTLAVKRIEGSGE